eukprot:Gb_40437 [translate_table: standard]
MFFKSLPFSSIMASSLHNHYQHTSYRFKTSGNIYKLFVVVIDVACEAGLVCHSTLAPAKEHRTLNRKWEWDGNPANSLCREGLLKQAFERRCIPVDYNMYASLFQACTNLKLLKQVHAQMLRSGLERRIFAETKFVTMYAMWGSMETARLVFDKINKPNVFLWNVMIRGYARNGPCEEALTLYNQMQHAGIQTDKYTYPFVLKACASLLALQEGKKIHDQIVRIGLESDVYVGNSLVTMYARWGDTEIARQLFDKMPVRDVVSWNAMIVGYAQNGHSNEALALFNQMQLTAMYSKCGSVEIARQLFDKMDNRNVVSWNTMITGYIQNGHANEALTLFCQMQLSDLKPDLVTMIARRLFDKMSRRNVVSWSAMIAGYALNGRADETLELFNQMQLADVKADSVTMVSVLPACAQLSALQQGKGIHAYIIKCGFESDVFVANALIDMYAKCGNIESARHLFEKMSKRDLVSWNSLIAGYGMHGQGEDALAVFSKMQQTSIKPNHITFVCVLSACSHAGMVDEGWQYFDHMIQEYGISPRVEHYACMVDLLGRAGHLDDAQNFIANMPIEPGASVWGALLGACRIHCNIELGERVAERLFDLEPENAGCYVLLSNIYAAAGRWDNVAKVRVMMKDRRLKKAPGCSLIEVNNRVHAFLADDKSHPQSEKIYATLKTLAGQMELLGYVPDTNFVLHEVEEEVKEHMLCSHSEKLAIAFGLINLSPGIPIQVTKNLRVCGDCHTAIKFISKIVEREIIVRDANRFHHFKDGLCSCRDYW